MRVCMEKVLIYYCENCYVIIGERFMKVKLKFAVVELGDKVVIREYW